MKKVIGLTISFLLVGIVTTYAADSVNKAPSDSNVTSEQSSNQYVKQCQKMMKNCPMAKNMTTEEKQMMMQKCQKKMESMTPKQRCAMMRKCSKMKDMTPEQKKKMMAKCKKMMMKCEKKNPDKQKAMMANCPMMGGEKTSPKDSETNATPKKDQQD
ncbi:MAG TPA: hypothetical protein QF753_14530 [Victivallales bacterium]|nr:hypothetical protein [Victivallales bacterium]